MKWITKHRGKVAIEASIGKNRWRERDFRDICQKAFRKGTWFVNIFVRTSGDLLKPSQVLKFNSLDRTAVMT